MSKGRLQALDVLGLDCIQPFVTELRNHVNAEN